MYLTVTNVSTTLKFGGKTRDSLLIKTSLKSLLEKRKKKRKMFNLLLRLHIKVKNMLKTMIAYQIRLLTKRGSVKLTYIKGTIVK